MKDGERGKGGGGRLRAGHPADLAATRRQNAGMLGGRWVVSRASTASPQHRRPAARPPHLPTMCESGSGPKLRLSMTCGGASDSLSASTQQCPCMSGQRQQGAVSGMAQQPGRSSGASKAGERWQGRAAGGRLSAPSPGQVTSSKQPDKPSRPQASSKQAHQTITQSSKQASKQTIKRLSRTSGMM